MNDLKQKTDHFLALANAATPGPWRFDKHPGEGAPFLVRPAICYQIELAPDADLIASAPDMATHLRALQAEVDRRTAECEALRVDAGRYRWLRGDGGPASIRWPRWEVKHWSGVWNPVQKQDMDEAIDTAMDRERGG